MILVSNRTQCPLSDVADHKVYEDNGVEQGKQVRSGDLWRLLSKVRAIYNNDK